MLISPAPDELIIPYHFVNREGHVLLRFERNNAINLFFLHRGQLYETGKDRLCRNRIVDSGIFDPHFMEHLAQNGGEVRVPEWLARILDREIPASVVLQDQTADGLWAKVGHRDRLGSEVEGKNASLSRHA